jgi:hypothetical protein
LDIDPNLADRGQDTILVEVEKEHRLEKLAVPDSHPESVSGSLCPSAE